MTVRIYTEGNTFSQ